MKVTPTSICPLFNVKVTEDESVAIGPMRVWAWGLLAFLTKFDRFDQDPIPLTCIVEARSKCMAMHLGTPLLEAMKEAFNLATIPYLASQGQPLPSLNHHKFWLASLEENIFNAYLNSLKLDADPSKDIAGLVYNGIMYTFCWNPVLACDLLLTYFKKLSAEVSGDNFWTFNPIHLVRGCLWIKDFRKLLLNHVEKFHPTQLRPLSFDVACSTMPSPPYRSIDETTVSDQDRAVYFVQDNPAAYMHTIAYSVLANSMNQNWGLYYFQSDDAILQ